jgi:hypothetical protein
MYLAGCLFGTPKRSGTDTIVSFLRFRGTSVVPYKGIGSNLAAIFRVRAHPQFHLVAGSGEGLMNESDVRCCLFPLRCAVDVEAATS